MLYSKGYKYQLRDNYTNFVPIFPKEKIQTKWIILSPNGKLDIRDGYAWDGSSGPTKDSKKDMAPSLEHDGLSQLMRLGLLSKTWKKTMDEWYGRHCVLNKMNRIRAKIRVAVLSRLHFYVEKEHKQKVYEAPQVAYADNNIDE